MTWSAGSELVLPRCRVALDDCVGRAANRKHRKAFLNVGLERRRRSATRSPRYSTDRDTPGNIWAVRSVSAWAACLSLVAGACAGGGRRDAKIHEAQLVGEATLRVQIDACLGDNRAEVDESATEVVVKVTTDDGEGGRACGDVLSIDLSEPLGDRVIVDGTTDDEVTLIPGE